MEKTTIWKKYKRNFSNSNNKKISTESKIDFFLTEEEIQFLIHRLIEILVVVVVGSHFRYNLHFKGSKCMDSIKWTHENYNYNVFFTAHFVTLTKNSYLFFFLYIYNIQFTQKNKITITSYLKWVYLGIK